MTFKIDDLSQVELAEFEALLSKSQGVLVKAGLEALPENLRGDVYAGAFIEASATMINCAVTATVQQLLEHCDKNFEWSSARRQEWAARMRKPRAE